VEETVEKQESVSVLVVDDRLSFRAAARAVIDLTDGFTYAGETETGEDAVTVVDATHPALVLMDINLPGINGLDATRRIRAEAPGTVVFLVSTYDAGDLPGGAGECGAAAYIRKEDFGPELLCDLWRDHAPRSN
jgi:DNA-binding NarL/FixJ family response regulator